jgi:hypothetical protein
MSMVGTGMMSTTVESFGSGGVASCFSCSCGKAPGRLDCLSSEGGHDVVVQLILNVERAVKHEVEVPRMKLVVEAVESGRIITREADPRKTRLSILK